MSFSLSKPFSKKAEKQKRSVWPIILILFITCIVYSQTLKHDFVNFDDDKYVYENRHVFEGITLDGIFWALTTTSYTSYWHPLTWMSHMLDCQWFGLNAGGHHLTNLLFHIANTLILFIVFKKMVGDSWRITFIAALFALHPLHVESVAWVAERKDVLSSFFWMLAVLSYVVYVKHRGAHRYLLILLLFMLGLMSKPMVVTLPCVLFLLDYWPLNRTFFQHSENKADSSERETVFYLIREKAPLFFLVVLLSVVTFLGQKEVGTVASLDAIPFKLRIENALISYVAYICKIIYPADMSVMYPYPLTIPLWKVSGSFLLLLCITFLALRLRKQRPYFIVGWLWYIGTMVPVIGLIQVGSQAMADRYTYIPAIGIFIVIVWGISDLAGYWRYSKVPLALTSAVFFLFLTSVTLKQIGYWKNSITLFKHAVSATSNNWLAYLNLGEALFTNGETDEAIAEYKKALEINPSFELAYLNMGTAMSKKGKIEEAIFYYNKALQIKKNLTPAWLDLGNAYYRMGDFDNALVNYYTALKIKPDYAEAYYGIGAVMVAKKEYMKAIYAFKKALEFNPYYDEAAKNLQKVQQKINIQ